ncbi:MAG: hypothetical protein ACR2JG_05085, partial [Geodermatophilaceae bacterium]
MFATAVDDDAVHRNPCRIAGAGQPNSPERPLIDLNDLDRLTAAMPEHMRALTTLTFWACLRIGEVVALRRSDIWLSDDLSTGTLRIERQEVEADAGRLETPPKAGSETVRMLAAFGGFSSGPLSVSTSWRATCSVLAARSTSPRRRATTSPRRRCAQKVTT